jgi:hypothetical protein
LAIATDSQAHLGRRKKEEGRFKKIGDEGNEFGEEGIKKKLIKEEDC